VQTGYLVLRLTMGVNFLLHGATRVPQLHAFIAATVKEFAGTALPAPLVGFYALAIPFIEVVLGVAITIGAGLRVVVPLAGIYMITLMAGTLLRAQYAIVSEQLLYSLAFVALIVLRGADTRSIDARRATEPDSVRVSRP
jgi:thiosulfate dehydrogenase [quinone] large subunit